MERKVEFKYSSLEYATILSLIKNISIGLESIKSYSYIDENVIVSINKHLQTINRYYKDLTYKFNSKDKIINLSKEDIDKIEVIFQIEYSYKPIVVEIWKHELINAQTIDQNEPYNLLVHMFRNDDPIEYIESVMKNNSIHCLSTSLISNEDDHKHFENENTNYGFVYDINMDNFLGACEGDAQLEQSDFNFSHPNKQSFYTVKNDENHPVNSYVFTYTHNYQMTLTKTPICLKKPYYINDNNTPFYNEIGLDKRFSKPSAIVYYYGNDQIDEEISDKVNYLASLYKLPVIKINSMNKKMI
jgi:hypothetical protein